MITEQAVRAGTVLHFDFKVLRGTAPEFHDQHPAVVISPTVRQRNRTVIIVPITSELSNESNPSAVEIFHAELNRRSPTGRTFAVCNLPVSIALKRPSLDYYRAGRPLAGNAQPHFEVRGEDLARIRAKVVEHLCTDAGLRSDATLHGLIGADPWADLRPGNLRSIPPLLVLPPWRAKATPKSVIKKAMVTRPASLPQPGIAYGASGLLLLRSTGPLPGNQRPRPQHASNGSSARVRRLARPTVN